MKFATKPLQNKSYVGRVEVRSKAATLTSIFHALLLNIWWRSHLQPLQHNFLYDLHKPGVTFILQWYCSKFYLLFSNIYFDRVIIPTRPRKMVSTYIHSSKTGENAIHVRNLGSGLAPRCASGLITQKRLQYFDLLFSSLESSGNLLHRMWRWLL